MGKPYQNKSRTTFKISSNIKAVEDMFKDLSVDIKRKYLVYAVNQVGDKGKTQAVRLASAITGLTTKRIKSRLTIRKASGFNFSYEIKTNARVTHVADPDFRPIQMKYGVRAKYYNKPRRFNHAFLRTGKGSQKLIAFIRKTDKRYPLKALFAFNLANEMVKDRIAKAVLEGQHPTIKERFYKKIDQHLARRLPMQVL